MKKWRLYKELAKHTRRTKHMLRTIEEQEALSNRLHTEAQEQQDTVRRLHEVVSEKVHDVHLARTRVKELAVQLADHDVVISDYKREFTCQAGRIANLENALAECDAPMPADMWRDSAKEPPEDSERTRVLVCYTGALSYRPVGVLPDYVGSVYARNVRARPEQYPYWQPQPKAKVIS